MTLPTVLADRVRESNVITGTGNVSLGGSVAGYRTFSSVLTNGQTTWYALVDNVANVWEIGLGTWNTGNTLSRTTVLASSNSNSLVNFAGNTCDCFIDLPAVILSYLGTNPFPITAAGSVQSVGQITVTGTNAGMAIVPNGTGAIMTAIPDNTSTGGNARGTNAIDLQTARTLASQVASGTQSVVVGTNNTASAASSMAVGTGNTASNINNGAFGIGNSVSGNASFTLGYQNTVTSQYSAAIGNNGSISGDHSFFLGESVTISNSQAVGFGRNVTMSGQGAIVFGLGNSYAYGARATDRGNTAAFIFNNNSFKGGTGELQVEEYTLCNETTGASALRLTADANSAGAANVAAIYNGNVGIAVGTIDFVALDVTSSTAKGYVYTCSQFVATTDGTTKFALSGSPSFSLTATLGSPAALAAAPTVTADTTNGGFNISVTPPSGNTDHWYFAARIRLFKLC